MAEQPMRSWEHVMLELGHRLEDPKYPEQYLLLYPSRGGYTAALEAVPLAGEGLSRERRLIDYGQGQTMRAAVMRVLEVRRGK